MNIHWNTLQLGSVYWLSAPGTDVIEYALLAKRQPVHAVVCDLLTRPVRSPEKCCSSHVPEKGG